MSVDKVEAIEQIQELVEQINCLGHELKTLFRDAFPSEHTRLDAYAAFDLTSSRNPYDTTIESALEHIQAEGFEDEDEDDY